jgi:outer membrane protein assembly factor BamD (BamD/ComL family)
VPVAKFQRAVCYLRLHRGHCYDDTAARKAEEILHEYVRKYPRGDRIQDAETLLRQIREDRAKLYLENARFYSFRERRPRAALVYLEAIVREASGSPAAEEAPVILADIARRAKDDPATATRARDLAAELERKRSVAAPTEPAAAAAAPAPPASPALAPGGAVPHAGAPGSTGAGGPGR